MYMLRVYVGSDYDQLAHINIVINYCVMLKSASQLLVPAPTS